MKHTWKIMGCFCQKGENEVKLQKVIFQKSRKLAENLHERPPIQNIQ